MASSFPLLPESDPEGLFGIKGFSVVDQLQAGVEIAVVLEGVFRSILA